MYILQNYNKFLIGDLYSFRWDDFYIHRFKQDYNRLVKFESIELAKSFLESNPQIEVDFDAWIIPIDKYHWT